MIAAMGKKIFLLFAKEFMIDARINGIIEVVK